MWEVFNMGCGFVAVVPEAARRRGGRDPRAPATRAAPASAPSPTAPARRSPPAASASARERSSGGSVARDPFPAAPRKLTQEAAHGVGVTAAARRTSSAAGGTPGSPAVRPGSAGSAAYDTWMPPTTPQ